MRLSTIPLCNRLITQACVGAFLEKPTQFGDFTSPDSECAKGNRASQGKVRNFPGGNTAWLLLMVAVSQLDRLDQLHKSGVSVERVQIAFIRHLQCRVRDQSVVYRIPE